MVSRRARPSREQPTRAVTGIGVNRSGSSAPPSVTSMVAPTPAACAAAAAAGSTICASTRLR